MRFKSFKIENNQLMQLLPDIIKLLTVGPIEGETVVFIAATLAFKKSDQSNALDSSATL